MPIFIVFATALAGVAFALWWTRGLERRRKAIRPIHLGAFENLIRSEDDKFLRAVLPGRQYRMARRARTRAIQQYLVWIAGQCSAVQQVLRKSNDEYRRYHDRNRAVTMIIVRLRVICLLLWCVLWIQRALPQLDLLPRSLCDVYRHFTAAVRSVNLQEIAAMRS